MQFFNCKKKGTANTVPVVLGLAIKVIKSIAHVTKVESYKFSYVALLHFLAVVWVQCLKQCGQKTFGNDIVELFVRDFALDLREGVGHHFANLTACYLYKVVDKVFVVDSKNLSTGIALQIIEASILAEQGMDAKDIVDYIQTIRPRVRASFVVDTLTYLHRGGRCSGLAALAGGALKLHPLISVVDGKMLPGKKYRGKMDRVIIDYVKDLEADLLKAKADRVFITHSGCEDEVIEAVKAQLTSLGYFREILVTRAGSVITSHCGPGTLGVLFIAGE